MQCRIGERVAILHQLENPADARTLLVRNANGHNIGFIGRNSWLHRAVIDEGRGARAVIKDLYTGQAGYRRVVIAVELVPGPIETCTYIRPLIGLPDKKPVTVIATRNRRRQPPVELGKTAQVLWSIALGVVFVVAAVLAILK